MSEMVERVARALAKCRAVPSDDWEPWVKHARAAIAAMREPTEAMCDRLARRLQFTMEGSDPSYPPETWESLSEPRRDRLRYWVRDLLRESNEALK